VAGGAGVQGLTKNSPRRAQATPARAGRTFPPLRPVSTKQKSKQKTRQKGRQKSRQKISDFIKDFHTFAAASLIRPAPAEPPQGRNAARISG